MIQCTNEMENITLSPTMKTKLKNRECVNKIRHGSPKLQEVLRERCRQRMRENRRRLFNRDPDVNPFSQVIDEPLDPEEALELESEILGEEEQWILQEYERMAQEEIEFLALTADQEFAEVICPKCQVSNLTESVSQITCKSCNFVLDSSMNLKSLGQVINKCVSTHSGICKETPGILPLSEKNSTSLYLVCDKCLTFIPII
ncbi:RIP-like protein isoform X2 [Hylaeus anthracinus]|uniref:RIP-like protein isoform X2 n=1 Tax=Hylaeus anthracinus TaxID=313031 RepID=UPI0023B8CC41|nr:RIP-like protein isoform X2 [Hylaeus anthracinus]